MTTHDINLLEGSGYEITLTVLTADSVPATTEEHEVYGALESCGARMSFSVSPTGEPGQWLVTIPPVLISGALALSYQIFVRRRATGHEWLVLSGTVRLRHRYASAGDALATPPLHASATLSADSAALTVTELHGVRGERGFSTYDIACRHGFEGSEAEWLASLKAEYASEAVAAVTPLATAAQTAAETATTAQKSALASADDASDAAMTASQHMADAESAAKTATAAATTAEAAAAAASSSAELAHEEYTAAAREASAAREFASVALEVKTEVENAASHATQAATAAAGAQSAALAAQAEAEAQATRAEEKADLLGDAALQGSNNTFAAGKTQTVNGIAVFNGETVLNGVCTGAEVDRVKAMAALQDLQGYKKGVLYHVLDGTIKTVRQAEVFSASAKTEGQNAGFYYIDHKEANNIDACLLFRYDKTCPTEIGVGSTRDNKARPSRANNLYANGFSFAGNSKGCFAALFIDGAHIFLKQSHDDNSGHYSFSVYDLGESDVLKKTNKLIWYIGRTFNTVMKFAVWGLVGEELELVAVFNAGMTYWDVTKSAFVLWNKAADVYAVRDETPELKAMMIAKNAEVANKDFRMVNNDVKSRTIYTAESTGGELVVTFAEAAGCGWQVERLPEWVTASVAECENGGQIVLTIAPNETGAARTDYMLFKSIGDHAHGYPCTVCNEIKQNA